MLFWVKGETDLSGTLPAAATVRPVNLEAFYLSVAEHNHSQDIKEMVR
jgi:hypothetical protein